MPEEEINANDEASSTSSSEAAVEDYFVEDDFDDAREDSGSEGGVDEEDDDDDGDAVMEPSDSDDNEDVIDSTSSSDDEDESGDEEGENAAAVDDDCLSSQGISNDSNNEQCTFDLTNLLAFNTHQINAAELYQKHQQNQKQQQQQQLNLEWYSSSPTIAIANTTTTSPNLFVNEAFLLAKAAEGTTHLLRELWKLPKEKTDVGLLAKLPLSSSAETKLPRSLVRRLFHFHYFSWMFLQFLSLQNRILYHMMYNAYYIP